MELHNSNSARDEPHAKFRRELFCSPWLRAESQMAMSLDQSTMSNPISGHTTN
jgi:hypothetical protein